MRRRLILVVGALVVAIPLVVYFAFPGLLLRFAQRVELDRAGLESASVEVGGHRIVYLIGGRGEPLILLHGFGADKSNWVRVAVYLTSHFRVVVPDLPGFGESTRDPSSRYAVPDQVERVHAFVQTLGLHDVNVGGNSMGGAIAAVYAAHYPQEVKSLWLLAPAFVESAKPSELDERLDHGENPLLVDDVAGFERLLDFVFVKRPAIPGAFERYLAEQAIVNRAFNEKIGRDFAAAPLALEKEVKGLPVPTLVMWGDHDRLVDVSGAEVLKSVMPKAEVVILPDVGHIPMVERPEEAAKAFLHFRGVAS
jgi:pimeloyl-ACP methyl ester carboxylesterase